MVTGGEAGDGPLIFIGVGEPSGDQLGSYLVEALRHRTGGRVRFAGLAGPRMQAAGLTSLFEIDELSVMGAEFLPKLRLILRRIRDTADAAIAARPDCVVLIDSQGFSQRVARRLAGAGIPVVQYVAPTVWAWHAGRAKSVARTLDHLLTIFPFESPFFEQHGLSTTFVGHPAAERVGAGGDGSALRARLGLPADRPVLCVLPGSRHGEVSRHGPVFADALRQVAEKVPDLHCLVPTVPSVAEMVADTAKGWPVPATLLREPAEKYDAFAASSAALAASGTVTVELAFAGVPTVVAYKLRWHAARIGRMILRTPWVCAVNVVMQQEVMPEYVLDRCDPHRIAAALVRLLTEPDAAAAQRRLLDRAREKLQVGEERPSERAADAILSLIDERGANTP